MGDNTSPPVPRMSAVTSVSPTLRPYTFRPSSHAIIKYLWRDSMTGRAPLDVTFVDVSVIESRITFISDHNGSLRRKGPTKGETHIRGPFNSLRFHGEALETNLRYVG
jgi:hypothetical protein